MRPGPSENRALNDAAYPMDRGLHRIRCDQIAVVVVRRSFSRPIPSVGIVYALIPAGIYMCTLEPRLMSDGRQTGSNRLSPGKRGYRRSRYYELLSRLEG